MRFKKGEIAVLTYPFIEVYSFFECVKVTGESTMDVALGHVWPCERVPRRGGKIKDIVRDLYLEKITYEV